MNDTVFLSLVLAIVMATMLAGSLLLASMDENGYLLNMAIPTDQIQVAFAISYSRGMF